MSDAYTPRTKVDDSQFQGIINIYTTERVVPIEKPLPDVGDAVTVEWGKFLNHIIIARGESPMGNSSQKKMWVAHLHVPASFAEQDSYNFSHAGADAMSRFYVMRRADYLKKSGAPPVREYLTMLPEVGVDEDPLFPGYVFATESVSKIGTDPNSIFIVIERIYMLSPKVAQSYDDDLDTDVTVTTEVIPAKTGASSSAPGMVVEIQPGNSFYDLKVTTACASTTYPRKLPSIPADIPYRFPALLRGMELVAVWARAESQEAAPAYKEAWYFSYDMVKPTTGPYEARVLRFLAADPDALRTDYPIQKIVTVNENIAIARCWAQASNLGNSAFADASQIEIPECIHGDIEIENADTISVGQNKTSLPATPGFQAFAAATTMVVGYEPRKTRYGLYEISITEMNVTGVYNGETVPFGTEGGDTGANSPPTGVPRPMTPTATVADDNTAITGKTSPFAEVSAKMGTVTLGRVMSDENGNYRVPLEPVFPDPQNVVVRARRSGVQSLPTPVTLHDLAPAAPSAAIAADLGSVSGVTEPRATIHIVIDAVAQVETATVVGTITLEGDATFTVTSALIPGSPLVLQVPLLDADSATAVAAKAAAVIAVTPAVNSHYIPAATGEALSLTARVAAMNDVTLNIAYDNGDCTGLTADANSDNTVPGRGAVSVTADENGNWNYDFHPALASGEVLTITASDGGGTSAPTLVVASASPPVLVSADFATGSYNTIVAAVELEDLPDMAVATVQAYLGDEAVGTAVIDGTGDWPITLVRPMIRGEVLQVVVRVVLAEAEDGVVRSNSIFVVAEDLALEKPTFTKTAIGYVGVLPAGADSIVVRLVDDADEIPATVHSNGNFVFTLPGRNGERYEIIARYPVGDSDPVYEYAEVIDPGPVYILPIATVGAAIWPNRDWYPAVLNKSTHGMKEWERLVRENTTSRSMYVYIPWWEPGMQVSITFPGQALDDITDMPGNPGTGLGVRYPVPIAPNLPLLVEAMVSLPDGRTVRASFDRSADFLIAMKF